MWRGMGMAAVAAAVLSHPSTPVSAAVGAAIQVAAAHPLVEVVAGDVGLVAAVSDATAVAGTRPVVVPHVEQVMAVPIMTAATTVVTPNRPADPVVARMANVM